LNPSDEDDHEPDSLLRLLGLNDREGALAKSLETRSPVSGAVPVISHPSNIIVPQTLGEFRDLYFTFMALMLQ